MNHIVFDIETTTAAPGFSERDFHAMEIAVVGAYDSVDDSYTSYTVPELGGLWPRIEGTDALVGFNSNTFDIPLLNKYYPGDLSRIKSIDLLVSVQDALGRRLRLQTLAEATLGVGKSATGLKAVEWWRQGLVDEVRAYCLQDVKVTKELFDYMRQHGIAKYRDLNEIKDIKIDTSSWESNADDHSLTHTLGI
jgi:DEAD/DEAH box helicase domain-containing protein